MDEVSTFLCYVQTGSFQPYYSIMEANNHILNSLLAHVCYKLFGDGIFVLRIPNLLAFILYSYYGFKIFTSLKNPFAKISWVVLLFGAQYFIEFFNIARGYGLSFSLLLGALYHLRCLFKTSAKKHFYWMLLCNVLMIFANLSLLSWSPIIVSIGSFIILKKRNKPFEYILILLSIVVYALSFIYLFEYATTLKKTGKLYLFAADNFYEAIFWGYTAELGLRNFKHGALMVVPILILTTGLFLINIRKMRSIEWMFLILMIGFSIGFILQNKFLHINYPPNRAGIQLWLVLILCYVHTINKNHYKWLSWITIAPVIYVCFFFVSKANLSFNSHWKGEAVPYAFLHQVEELNKTEKIPLSVSIHPLEINTWNYYSYNNRYSVNMGYESQYPDFNCDLVLLSRDYDTITVPSNFDTIGYQKKTKHILLKKKDTTHNYSTIEIGDFSSSDTFLEFYVLPLDHARPTSIKLGISFQINFPHHERQTCLVFCTEKKFIKFDVNIMKNDQDIRLSTQLSVDEDDKYIKFYVWNVFHQFIKMKDITLFIEQIDQNNLNNN